MIRPAFLMNSSGMPLIRMGKIESWCERFLREYDPALLTSAGQLDLDDFVRRAVGFRVRNEFLSHNASVLGITIFAERDDVVVFDPAKQSAAYISCPANTILVDKTLEAPAKQPLYRFTLAHEIGHAVWHRTWFERQRKAWTACAESDITSRAGMNDTRLSPERLLEAQANRTASCLLMPRRAVENWVLRYRSHEPRSYDEKRDLAFELAPVFGVSHRAAMIRIDTIWQTPVSEAVREARLRARS